MIHYILASTEPFVSLFVLFGIVIMDPCEDPCEVLEIRKAFSFSLFLSNDGSHFESF